ncbi:hypothetical protein ZWY2020_057753 [Hordeum vulgare]|nr:hypothetical protein ZWY2020_057753 [Hordeum vulgare]
MAPTSPTSAPRLLLALSLSLLLLTSAHQLTAPSPPAGISPELVSTLREALDAIEGVASVVSTFPVVGGVLGGADRRLSSAITDCLDLLDLSSDELSWSMSAASPSTAGAGAAGRVGTGDAHADLRAWLSGALGNQDTCKDGLDDTDSVLGSLVSTGLQAVTSLLGDGLGQVAAAGEEAASSARTSGHRGRGLGEGSAPALAGREGRRLLQMLVGPGGMPVDAVVAQDGSSNHTTVHAAVDAAPSGARRAVRDLREAGRVQGDGGGEEEEVERDDAVVGKGFNARDKTVENTAGPAKHPAVALRCDSDLSVVYRCAFEGHQDTLYAHSLRQFYRDCRVAGTVDIVFCNAAAVFQNCLLLARAPLPGQKNSVTAQGRFNASMNSGFAFQFCNVSAHDDLLRQASRANKTTAATQTFLGRPWKAYSRVVFMQSYIGTVVRPEGWLAWDANQSTLATLYYGEYMNTGPGAAGVGGRVRWPGYHLAMSPAEASNFTVAQFIEGNMWLPTTGVRFTSGLLAS